MFRSLFGTVSAGEDSSAGAAGGGAGGASNQQQARKGALQAGSVSAAPRKDSGGFFQLEPTNASASAGEAGGAIVLSWPRGAIKDVVFLCSPA